MGKRLTIYTVGYMRSGNNWLSRTLSDLFCAPIVRSGGDTRFAATILDEHEIMMTHWDRKTFNEKGYPNPVVYMMRDPRDMAVSLMYFKGHQNLSHTIGALVDDGYGDWVQSWILRPTPLSISYEMMHQDQQCFDRLKGIHAFITDDEPILDLHITAVIERQKFSNWLHLDRRLNRRGKTGDWENHFTQPAAKTFEHHFGWILRTFGYEPSENWWMTVPKELP